MPAPPTTAFAVDLMGLGISGSEFLVIFLVCVLGAVCHGSLGVGLGLVASVPLVIIDPAFAPGPLLFAGQIVGARHIVAEWSHLPRAEVRQSLLGVLPGLGLGLLALRLMDPRSLAILIGISIAVSSLLLLRGWRLPANPQMAVFAGALSTFCSTTAAIPGPPLVMAFSELNPRAFRALVSVVIVAIATSVFVGLVITGRFGGHEAALLALMVPGMLVGLVASRWTRPLLDGRTMFRTAILLLALVAGIVLVLRQL